MKIKLSLIALLAVAAFADVPYISDGKKKLNVYPIAPEYRLKEFGGLKDAADAYKDGVGVYVGTVNPDDRINNQPLAELVEKYGETAKANGVSLIDEVSFGSGTVEDKEKLSGLFSEGSACDDGSPISFVSTYVNGQCMPDTTEGSACDDQNDQTSGDKWVSKVCVGVSSNPFLTYDGNYMGFTAAEAANMKAYLGLSNFDLTLVGHGALIPSTQNLVSGSNKKHLLILIKTRTNKFIGGYTGENYFDNSFNGCKPQVGGEFIFNLTNNFKQMPDKNKNFAICQSPGNIIYYLGGNDFKFGGSSSYQLAQHSYGLNDTYNILGSLSYSDYSINKIAYYIVSPK